MEVCPKAVVRFSAILLYSHRKRLTLDSKNNNAADYPKILENGICSAKRSDLEGEIRCQTAREECGHRPPRKSRSENWRQKTLYRFRSAYVLF